MGILAKIHHKNLSLHSIVLEELYLLFYNDYILPKAMSEQVMLVY